MSWIQTHSGRVFDLLQPHPDAVDIDDIAHALAQICRFTGHTDAFYSVAQHSVIVSRIVPDQDALAGLLHDATEAYVGDVSRPLKSLLPDYKQLERRIWDVIAKKYGVPSKLPASVKEADNVALMTERRDLLSACGPEWDGALERLETLPDRIKPLTPYAARELFLARWIELTTPSLAAA